MKKFMFLSRHKYVNYNKRNKTVFDKMFRVLTLIIQRSSETDVFPDIYAERVVELVIRQAKRDGFVV